MEINKLNLEELDLNALDIEKVIKIRISRLEEVKQSVEKEISLLYSMLGEKVEEKKAEESEDVKNILSSSSEKLTREEALHARKGEKIKRLSNLTKQKIKSLWEEGKTGGEVAELLGINFKTVQYYITKFNKEAGIYLPNQKLRSIITSEVEDKIYTMVAEGLSAEEIISKLGIKRVTFFAWKRGREDLVIKGSKKSVMSMDKYEKLLELAKSGKSRMEAAMELDITLNYLHVFLRRHPEITFVNTEYSRRASLEEKILIKSLIEEGKTNSYISRKLGFSLDSIDRIRKKM